MPEEVVAAPVSTPAVETPAVSTPAVPVAQPPNPPAPKEALIPVAENVSKTTGAFNEPLPVTDGKVEDDYDFGKWDLTVESLPDEYKYIGEQLKPTIDKFATLAEQLEEMQAIKTQAEEYKLLYDALSDGSEDPRIAQYASERDALKAEVAEIKAGITATENAEAKNMWEKFKTENPLITKTPGSMAVIRDLLGEEWSLDIIPQLVTLPKNQFEEVRTLAKSGVPKAQAMELVQLRNASAKSEPKTAHLVSGADDPRGNPAELERGHYKKRGYNEQLDDAIARALRKNS